MGDLFLKQVAGRIASTIRKADTVTRMGGDEFTLIIENISELNAIKVVADKIISTIKEPYTLLDEEVTITCSIGISIYPNNGSNVNTLTQKADIALYRAKNSGKNQYYIYDADKNDDSAANMRL